MKSSKGSLTPLIESIYGGQVILEILFQNFYEEAGVLSLHQIKRKWHQGRSLPGPEDLATSILQLIKAGLVCCHPGDLPRYRITEASIRWVGSMAKYRKIADNGPPQRKSFNPLYPFA